MVSVCIRAFERSEELRDAISSVLAQSYRGEFEVVVSDDSGRLREVVEEFRDARVRYVANPMPSGPPGNLRHAVRHAQGDVLAMLSDDDWWEPRFLEVCMDAMGAGSVDVVFTDHWFDIGGRRVQRRFPYAPGRHDRFLAEVLEDALPVSGTVIRRAAFADPPDGVVGDFYMSLAAASAGAVFHYVPEPLSVTRVHRGQGTWAETGLPTRIIATLEEFRFDDHPRCEVLRRARLGEQYLIRAGRLLRRGRLKEARADMRRARACARSSLSRRRALLALTGVRGVLMRAAGPRTVAWVFRHWPRLRPTVLARRGDPVG